MGLGGTSPRPACVLVVQNDPAVAAALQAGLELAGYVVVTVSAGKPALASADQADLVLLGDVLPDVDGLAVCRTLRARPELARLPIVILSERGQPHDRARAFEAGADVFVAGPVRVDDLVARLGRLLRTRRAETELPARPRQFQTLYHLTTTLVNTIAVEELAQRIVDAVVDAFGPDSDVLGGVVLSIDREHRRMRALAVTDIPVAHRCLALIGRSLDEIESVFDPPRNLLDEVALTGEPRQGDYLTRFIAPTIPLPVAQAIERLVGIRGVVAQPARAQGQTIGVFLFVLTKSSGALTATERALMAEFANTAGVAIENVRLYAVAERLMLTDSLTGVANRRHFDRVLENEVARAHRFDFPLGLLLVDVDDFKTYNDRYGHLAGDRALRAIADALQQSVRAIDLVARYGGDEFAVILPNAAVGGARQAGERVRRAVEHLPTLSLTTSVGAAAGKTVDGPELVAAADAALYTAKRTGRNRTVAHAAGTSPSANDRPTAGAEDLQ